MPRRLARLGLGLSLIRMAVKANGKGGQGGASQAQPDTRRCQRSPRTCSYTAAGYTLGSARRVREGVCSVLACTDPHSRTRGHQRLGMSPWRPDQSTPQRRAASQLAHALWWGPRSVLALSPEKSPLWGYFRTDKKPKK